MGHYVSLWDFSESPKLEDLDVRFETGMETLFRTRDFEQGDYARLSEILHSVYPEYHRSPEELRFEDEMFDRNKYMLKRYSVVEPDHMGVIATGEYRHNPKGFILRSSNWASLWTLLGNVAELARRFTTASWKSSTVSRL